MDRLPDSQNKKTGPSSVAYVAIFAGIFGVIYNVHNDNRYYLGGPLTTKQIVISDKPEYISGGKGGTTRYSFAGHDYKCRFWLSEGSYEAVTENDSILTAVKSVKVGDTIQIKIRTTDDAFLNYDSKKIRVMGFATQNNILVDPDHVNRLDSKNRIINLWIASVALLGGMAWKINAWWLSRRLNRDKTFGTGGGAGAHRRSDS